MMEDLHSWWEVPSIAHYCSLFRSAFDLADFDIEDLEEALIESEKEEGSEFISDLVCRLLNGCYGRKDVTSDNLDLYVKDVIKFKWGDQDNPINEKSHFNQLNLREKVELILALCEYRLDTEDVADLLKGFEGDNMRVEPLGKDKEGGTYWYFYGSRLYKEDQKKEISTAEKKAQGKKKKRSERQKKEVDRKKQKREKEKLKEQKKLEKKKKLEEARRKKEENKKLNVRRSGRIKLKQVEEEIESDLSECSSSSLDESEETEDSSTEEEPEDEEEMERIEKDATPLLKGTKKTSAQQKSRTSFDVKETPPHKERGAMGESIKRKTNRISKTPQTPVVEETNVRRSGRMRRPKGTPAPRPKKPLYDSNESEDNDVDSGHESAESDDNKSVMSEVSKVSAHSTYQEQGRTARKPQSKMELKRKTDLDEDEDIDDDDADMDNNVKIGTLKGVVGDAMNSLNDEDTPNNGDEELNTDTKDMTMEKQECDEHLNAASFINDAIAEIKVCEVMDDKSECADPPESENTSNTMIEESVNAGFWLSDVEKSDSGKITGTSKTFVISEQKDETMKEALPDLKDEIKKTEVCEQKREVMEVENDGQSAAVTEQTEDKMEADKEELLKVEEVKCDDQMMVKTLFEDTEMDPVGGHTACSEARQENVGEEHGLDAPSCLPTLAKEVKSYTLLDMAPVHKVMKTSEEQENKPETDYTDSSEVVSRHKSGEQSSKDFGLTRCATEDSGLILKTEDLVKREIENVDETFTKVEPNGEVGSIEQVNLDISINDFKETIKTKIAGETNEFPAENPSLCEQENRKIPSTPMLASKNKLPPVVELSMKSNSDRPGTVCDTGWHLVCETLDDWLNLAESLKDTCVRCEKSLAKVIREDFIPVLPEIIEAREAEKKKRLQDQEVRRSHRLTIKQMEKLEQERILAEALAEEEKARICDEDEKRVREEQLRLEDENRQREERMRAREERAKRLSMREEKARLLAEGKEIPAELIYTGSHKYRDDSDSDDSRCDLKDDESYETLNKIIEAMKLHKDCWPFLEPVTDDVAPGYSEVIKRPMDMSKIEEKVKSKEYRSSLHFLSDFRLMFNNCKRFNGQDSEFTECARSMEKMLKKYVKRFLTDEPSDKYYNDKDFHVSVKGTGEKKFRPKRAASSRALHTVHKALNSDYEEESSDDSDSLEPLFTHKKKGSPFKTPSHNSLLLQEMIEMKRQRERKLAASALENHKVITRGPERVRIPNPAGGVMIIPKDELPPTGVLRLAATREIRRKVHAKPMVDASKKDPSLNVIDKSKSGAQVPKTIRIVTAQGANGQASVKETAESVRVSADGFLIISGKNSGIRVTENTKIVIQPPPTSSASGSGYQPLASVTKEIVIKKVPSQIASKPCERLPAQISTIKSCEKLPAQILTSKSCEKLPAQILTSKSCEKLPAQISTSKVTGVQKTAASLQQLPQQSEQVKQQELERMIQLTKLQAKALNLKGSGPEAEQKQRDITQRILMLNQQKRKLLQQRQLAQHQQQNGDASDANLPKITKLVTELPVTADTETKSIEERLREPSPDNPIGQVTKQVVGSVNISSDILDTYYSVLNANKPSPASSHFLVTESPDTSLDSENDVTNTLDTVVTRSLNHANSLKSSSKPSSLVPVVNTESTVVSCVSQAVMTTRITTISSGNVLDSQNSSDELSISANTNQNVLACTNCPETMSVPCVSQSETAGVGTLVTPISVDLGAQADEECLPSVHSDNVNGTEPASAIEALFTSSLPSSIALPTSISDGQAFDTGTYTSPSKTNSRQNLFDMFEPVKKADTDCGVSGSVTSSERHEYVSRDSDGESPNKKLKVAGMNIPSASTVNFGSPLKTTAIMEALKVKLGPGMTGLVQGPETINLEQVGSTVTDQIQPLTPVKPAAQSYPDESSQEMDTS